MCVERSHVRMCVERSHVRMCACVEWSHVRICACVEWPGSHGALTVMYALRLAITPVLSANVLKNRMQTESSLC